MTRKKSAHVALPTPAPAFPFLARNSIRPDQAGQFAGTQTPNGSFHTQQLDPKNDRYSGLSESFSGASPILSIINRLKPQSMAAIQMLI